MAKKEIKTYSKKEKIIYTDQALKEFDKEIQEARFDYKLKNGEIVRPVDWNKIMIRYDVLNKDNKVIVNDCEYAQDKDGNTFMSFANVPLKEFENKKDQWEKYKNRIDWIDSKKLEGLQEIANSMEVF